MSPYNQSIYPLQMSARLAKLDHLVGFLHTVQPETLTAIETLQRWDHKSCSHAETNSFLKATINSFESKTCDSRGKKSVC